MESTPTTISDFTAGNTVSWIEEFPDYQGASPAWSSEVVLSLLEQTTKLVVPGVETADGFTYDIASAVSANVAPGKWSFDVFMKQTTGALRYIVKTGMIEVFPDPTKAKVDNRSYLQKCLDAINAVILGRASTDQMSMSIAGRSLMRMSVQDLFRTRDKFKAELAKEQGVYRPATKVRFTEEK